MPKTKSTNVTSAELFKQSDALRRQAEELKRKEIPEVVARIKEAIAHYGLTAQDLGLAAKAAKKSTESEVKEPSLKKSKTENPQSIKYRDEAGHAWSGRGPKPKWFKDALAAGATEQSLTA